MITHFLICTHTSNLLFVFIFIILEEKGKSMIKGNKEITIWIQVL